MTQRIFIILLFFAFAFKGLSANENKVQFVSIKVDVQKDGSVLVTERSKVSVKRFSSLGTSWKRVLPASFEDEGRVIRKIPLTVESLKLVKFSYPHKKRTTLQQHVISFNPEITRGLIGGFEVEFTYRTDGHIFNRGEYQDLFLEVMGASWFLRVDSMVVDVHLPNNTQVLGFNGACGGMYKVEDCEQSITQVSPNHIRFSTSDSKRSSMAYSIEVRFPEDTFPARNSLWNIRFTLMDHGVLIGLLVASLLLFVVFMRAWNKYGMGPEPQKLEMRESPPEDFGPGLIAYLEYRDQSHYGSLGAVLELAVKGALKIEYSDGAILLHELDFDFDQLSRPEQVLHQVLFHHSDSIVLGPDNYNVVFHRAISAYKNTVEKEVSRGDYYGHPWRPWFPGLLLSLASLGVCSLLLPSQDLIPIFIVSGIGAASFSYAVFNLFFVKANKGSKVPAFAIFLLSLGCAAVFTLTVMLILGVEASLGLILLMGQSGLFYRLMAALTESGRKALDEVEAYKLFLKDGPSSNALSVTTLSKHLPYAATLDLTKEWLQHFESLSANPHYALSWYNDDEGTLLGDFSVKTGRKFLSVLMRSIIRSSSGGEVSNPEDFINY